MNNRVRVILWAFGGAFSIIVAVLVGGLIGLVLRALLTKFVG